MRRTLDHEALYRAVVPSVVSVYRDGTGHGAGPGFVFDADHVVTNEHVVRGLARVDVRFADGAWTTVPVE
jgi:S1-C subfamily serine protease